MAPKKTHQQQQRKPNAKGSSSSSKRQSSGAKDAPKVQISAENERRLRRLLLNTERPSPAPANHPDASASASLSQRAKRLRSVYDKLSLEGFTSDQIERALSALNEGATFESALDWLCLNLPENELPLKFSRGAVSSTPDGSEQTVTIISTARNDWVPSHRSLENINDLHEISIRRKDRFMELGKSAQAEWIRQYMERQKSEEDEEQQQNEKDEPQDADSMFCEATILEEYRSARLGAIEAKERGDREAQQRFSQIICKMRQQMTRLGFSDDISILSLQGGSTCPPSSSLDSAGTSDLGVCPVSAPLKMEPGTYVITEDSLPGKKNGHYSDKSNAHDNLMVVEVKQEQEELELDSLFSEDASSSENLSSEGLKPQKKEKSSRLIYGNVLADIHEIWKKGDAKMIPKAVLQKLCQRLGWEAPKYNKLSEKESELLYNVNILRPASGRGKNRKAGGLITIQLPDKIMPFASVEDAQNTVAAFALCQLFPGAPFDEPLVEPYSSFIRSCEEEMTELDKEEETRRSDFVDFLLKTQTAPPRTTHDPSNSHHEHLVEAWNLKDVDSCHQMRKTERFDSRKQAVGNFLKLEQEGKKKLPKYMKILEARAALPMFGMRNKLFELLRLNDVVVVCGETGSGKTTQVPQFILDDMIESGMGGYCSIVCTQPRRIAATSVAERVSDERCEPPPGHSGSIVGYQVRLESSRNERTRLLFCTTGILLRRLAGDKDLSGVTHVIVDEVHERSLLGDFLLIILKSLIERRSASGSNLKVILMSATVDSSLFSKYFGNCPIVNAEGRTHNVETFFLEDIYEKLSYCLPSDSPASGRNLVTTKGKVLEYSVDNRRGKRSTVLSGWGDETLLDQDYINPHYIASEYGSYGERTRQNLKKLNEDTIDFELLEDLIFFIDDNYLDGAVLVFVPGVAEINMLVDRLVATYRFSGLSSDWVLPLHSSLASTEQRNVFLTPPQGIRKVIIATDIAETSITIDDVVYVIDTGKHKEKRYNPQRKMSSMVEDWVSRANAKQRRGRAGRVKAGVCFCLYTRHRFETLMRSFQVPEILRLPLAELCLQIKALSLGNISSFLSKAIEPPTHDAISSAISLLYEVGALEGDEELTPLGYHLAKLPVDVLIGKMMLYGAIFGCLSPILTIAASLSYKLPFAYPKDEKLNAERAKQLLLGEKLDSQADTKYSKEQSDHVLLVIAYDKWSRALRENGSKAAQQLCRSFFLSNPVMYMLREMRMQFGHLLADIGLINLPPASESGGKMKDLDGWFADISQPFNMYSLRSPIIKTILCAGLYPNVAASSEGIYGTAFASNRTSYGGQGPAWYDGKREVHIHPSSVNFNVKHFQHPFMVFLEKVETSKIFLRDTTVVSPYAILLFGGSINVQHQVGTVIVDGWLKLTAPAPIAVLFKELRLRLQVVLKELIRKPEIAIVVKDEVLRSIIQLLLEEDKSHGQ